MTSPTEPAQLYEKYQELQRYVGWSDYDVQRVRAAGRVIEPYLPQVIRDFYDEIHRHQDTRILITGGREQVKRLQKAHDHLHHLYEEV